MVEKQELYCHNCDKYVQFDIDVSLNGNHEIVCPNCGHIHYRVVQNGRITSERWNSSLPTYQVSYTTSSSTSTYVSYTNNLTTASSSNDDIHMFLYTSWMNATASS